MPSRPASEPGVAAIGRGYRPTGRLEGGLPSAGGGPQEVSPATTAATPRKFSCHAEPPGLRAGRGCRARARGAAFGRCVRRSAQLAAWRAALRGRRRQPTVCVNIPRRPAAGVAGPGAAKVSSLGRGYAPRSSSFRRPPCLVPRRIHGTPRERCSPTPTRCLKGGPPRASGGNEPVGGTRRSPGCFACTTRRTITHENATAKSPGDEHVSDRRARAQDGRI
jgi:hypothetical protein